MKGVENKILNKPNEKSQSKVLLTERIIQITEWGQKDKVDRLGHSVKINNK